MLAGSSEKQKLPVKEEVVKPKRLSLSKQEITDEGLLNVFPALKQDHVIDLDLSGNLITAKGLKALAGELRRNNTLLRVSLDGNDFVTSKNGLELDSISSSITDNIRLFFSTLDGELQQGIQNLRTQNDDSLLKTIQKKLKLLSDSKHYSIQAKIQLDRCRIQEYDCRAKTAPLQRAELFSKTLFYTSAARNIAQVKRQALKTYEKLSRNYQPASGKTLQQILNTGFKPALVNDIWLLIIRYFTAEDWLKLARVTKSLYLDLAPMLITWETSISKDWQQFTDQKNLTFAEAIEQKSKESRESLLQSRREKYRKTQEELAKKQESYKIHECCGCPKVPSEIIWAPTGLLPGFAPWGCSFFVVGSNYWIPFVILPVYVLATSLAIRLSRQNLLEDISELQTQLSQLEQEQQPSQTRTEDKAPTQLRASCQEQTRTTDDETTPLIQRR